jgi:multidrug efflux system membrane fusion protein
MRVEPVKAGGKKRRSPVGAVLAIVLIGGAVVFAYEVDRSDRLHPSSDDASIDADILHVAPSVGGRVIELPIVENQLVAEGDLLFCIDPEPYEYAVQQAEAALAIARAEVDSEWRRINTETANFAVAKQQVTRAKSNYELASRTVDRLRPLEGKAYVPAQEFDRAQVTLRDSETSLIQARDQERAASSAVNTLDRAEADVQAREAALAIAQRDLRQTVVRAPVAGRVTSMNVTVGEVLAPSQTLFTLISTEKWFAVANMREAALNHIAIGDCATVYSLIDRKKAIAGRVVSLGWGVQTEDRATSVSRSLPYVARDMDWVHVAQRFPVRVGLENPPEHLVRIGASASVEIKHGESCR